MKNLQRNTLQEARHSTIKLLSMIFLTIFLVGIVSATEFDNSITYFKGENGNPYMKVEVKNWFGLGTDYGTLELKSHNSVDEIKSVSKDSGAMMWYEFNFNEVYENGFGEIKVLSDGKEVKRDYHFVVGEVIGVQTQKDLIAGSCKDIVVSNGTTQECSYTERQEPIYSWTNYNLKDIPKGKFIVGVVLDNARMGELLDIVWEVAGKEIDRHAFIYVTDAHGQAMSNVGVETVARGVLFQYLIDTNLTNVTKHSGVNATRARILNSSGGTLATASFTGDVATFTPVNIVASTNYSVVIDSSGGEYNAYRTGAVVFPITVGNLSYRRGYPNDVPDRIYNLVSITSRITDTLSVTLLAPENNTEFLTGKTHEFIGTLSSGAGGFGITNVSLIINGSIFQTNTSGVEGTYNFTENNLSVGDYNWTIYAEGSDGIRYNATNGTLDFLVSDFLNNGATYNATSFETAIEDFSVNLTTNGTTPTNPFLWYNGTSYAGNVTSSGSNFILSRNISIPTTIKEGNKSFNFTFDLGATESSTTNVNQFINYTNFTLCDGTFTTKFLNISFKDESTLTNINASIPASTFEYYLGDGSINKTLEYSTGTDNFDYTFCGNPTNRTLNVNPYVQYKQGTSYPQRIWDIGLTTYNSNTTNETLYLLSTANGIFVTFQVVNSADQLLEGVTATAIREISGTNVTVGLGTTGVDGTVTFWLNPDFSHHFSFAKDGFSTVSFNLIPTQSSYTVTMGEGETTAPSLFRGIEYALQPINKTLFNDTSYDFGFNLSSSYWALEEYGFNLRLDNGTIITGNTTTTSGTLITRTYNTNNQSIIYMDYYWLINSTYTNATTYWIVIDSGLTDWSISQWISDFKMYMDSGLFGLDNFGRMLIIFLVIFFTIGILSYKYGFTNPVTIYVLTFGIIFMFDVVFGLIPAVRGINHAVTLVASLILVLLIMREVQT